MSIKRAIGYVRISTKDQSTYSLEGQADAITRYCEKKGWELMDIRTDDGQSAKSFDRAEWKILEAFVKKNFRQLDYIVVMKYDRFSRNVEEALQMLGMLEKKYNIRVISTMEDIGGLDPRSPFFFQIRAQMLVGAETELRIIRDRTKFGLVNAARNGRHIGIAPYGYITSRDEHRKPTLHIDPDKAPLVQEAFNMYLADTTMAEIIRKLSPKGFTLKGKSALQRMFTNSVYAGLIKVPAYYDEPEQMVPAKHDAIIDKVVWWQVQAKITGKTVTRIVYNEDVPLRGVVHCHCGRPLTAGNSKGRKRYYWYYKCPQHVDVNLRADVLHQQFDELLDELSLSDYQLEYLKQTVAKMVDQQLADQNRLIAMRKKELDKTNSDIDSLEEKYITNLINNDTYTKWMQRLTTQKIAQQRAIDEMAAPVKQIWSSYMEHMHNLTKLRNGYTKSDLQAKHAFIAGMFNKSLYYKDGCYRTAFLHPVFGLKAALVKEKGLLIVEQPLVKSGLTPVSSEDGDSVEPFLDDLLKILDWAASVKAA